MEQLDTWIARMAKLDWQVLERHEAFRGEFAEGFRLCQEAHDKMFQLAEDDLRWMSWMEECVVTEGEVRGVPVVPRRGGQGGDADGVACE